MTYDEKLAIIAGNIRAALSEADGIDSLISGAMFELAMLALEKDNPDDALNCARLVIPSEERTLFAEFCKLYYKYGGKLDGIFTYQETAELPDTVIIPEIMRLDEAAEVLLNGGLISERIYGDSFAACAEDVEYGHSGYVLMPMSDPEEGRLRSFDRLRDKFGLKIHAVVNLEHGDGGVYGYQLCALGLPAIKEYSPERFSFTADVGGDITAYLWAIERFGVRLLTAEIVSSRVRAVADTSSLDRRGFAGLMMYLGEGAIMTVDGYYNEI